LRKVQASEAEQLLYLHGVSQKKHTVVTSPIVKDVEFFIAENDAKFLKEDMRSRQYSGFGANLLFFYSEITSRRIGSNLTKIDRQK